MQEPLIKEIVEIEGGYTSYVDLKLELFDDNKNVGRMSRYRPITSHRQAFQRLAKSLNIKDRRVYLLTGSYGTGKSHLLLMFANYLQTPAVEHPMIKFFENFTAVEPELANDLKAKRQSGRYLVALCDWGGKADFEEVVLRAVDEALKREGFAGDLETPYLQALLKLDEWKALADVGDGKGRFYTEFEHAVAERDPGQTMPAFRMKLQSFDYPTLEEFKRIHHIVTTVPFVYDKSALVAILTSTLASAAFKARYSGILVLFDEFGDTMEKGNLSPKAFQQFAQLCADTPTNCANLIFLGTAHKDLTSYSKAYNLTDFRTASDRIESVPLTPDGVEDIISVIVVPKKETALWKEKVVPRAGVLDGLLKDCIRLQMFNWLRGPQIRKSIIEDIYPMHPMATYALLQLSRDISSNNRSVFTFFSADIATDSELGSYGQYVATTPIEESSKLNLYTVDRLADYFTNTLKSDNTELRDTVREQIKDFESSLRELNRVSNRSDTDRALFHDDALIRRILRVILIYNIIQVPSTRENLQFGLYATTRAEISELQHRLDALSSKGILYFMKDKGVYEFKHNTSIDLDRLIQDYLSDPNNVPTNVVAELTELVPLDRKGELYIEAKDYNVTFAEDKRLQRRLVRPADLSTQTKTPQGVLTYFQMLEAEIEQETKGKGAEFEGLAIHVVCEKPEDIQKAKDYCGRNESQRIVVAIPQQPVPFTDDIMRLRALLAIKGSDAAQNFSVQDQSMLRDRLDGSDGLPGAREVLRARRNTLLNSKEVTWHGPYAAAVVTDAGKPHDVANRVMELMYAGKRNSFAHDDFNKVRVRDTNKNHSLREAVEKLLDYTSPVIIDTSFPQKHGDIRYLQRCFLTNGALVQPKKPEGVKIRCEPATKPETFENALVTLADMVREVQMLRLEERLKLTDWVTKYRQPPYGQGPISLALSLAFLIRLLGDSIRIKVDEAAVGDLVVRSFETVLDLIDGEHPNAFLSYRQLRSEEKHLLKLVYTLFRQRESAAREFTVGEAHSAVRDWWNSLPPISRVASFYPMGTNTASFISVMQKVEARDAYSFLFDDLPTACGADAATLITQDIVSTMHECLPKEKQALESVPAMIEDRIMDGIRTIFDVQQSTYGDIVQAISAWYNGLDSHQRDSHAPWQDNNSKPLVLQLQRIERLQDSLRDTFLRDIPSSTEYGMKPVLEWMTDRVGEFLRRLEQGKVRIDNHRIKVELAKITFEGIDEDPSNDSGPVKFKDYARLTFHHGDPKARIYIAEGTNDPTNPSSSRKQVNGTEPLVITNNCTLRLAVQDAEGNWSHIQTIPLINMHEQYQIKLTGQRRLPGQDEHVTFLFPADADSFEVTCKSLFALGVERGLLTTEELANRVRAIADELARGQ